MNYFIVNYKDGSNEIFKHVQKTISSDITEISFAEDVNYKNIENIDFVMNADVIKAGDEGYCIIQSGMNGCISRDYGICFYKERPDDDVVIKNIFMPVLGFKHFNKCEVLIATGMGTNLAQVVTIKDNEYLLKARFEIDGIEPYEPIKMQIHSVDKPDATYCDMAKVYREYQLSHGFKPLKERINPELKYSVESVNVRIRMAWKPVPCEIKEQTPENEPDVHVACTFDDVIRIMESYKAAGIEKAEFCLVGWNMKGHDGRWPQILPVESSIGGEEGLKKVIKRAQELGYAMTCHTNSTDAYSIAENFDINDMIINAKGETDILSERWSGGRTYNICPKRAYEITMETLPAVAELGFRGMHYIDVITAIRSRVCFNPDHPLNPRECCEYFDKIFEKAKGMFGSVGSEGPYDCCMKNCDFALYVSFANYLDENNKFKLLDKQIPFWQLVYHGIVPSNPYARTVNFTISDSENDALKVIEYGGKPQVYYYAKFVTDGRNWIGDGDFHCNTDEDIAYSTENVKKMVGIHDELKHLQYEFMENHCEIAPDIFEVTYSDGSVVTVDYNSKTYNLRK